MRPSSHAPWFSPLADVERIRARAPVVHNVTNLVVMNTTANALLAIGASPIMAHALGELDELLAIAGALVLNIGTLDEAWVASMEHAALAARARGVPIVLDPVGCGATALRTEVARRLVERARPAIVRGNASEILALAGQGGGTRGVDSTDDSGAAIPAARAIAERTGGAVSVSGKIDAVVSMTGVHRVKAGHPMMARVTGMGCTASALAAAFAAVNPDPHAAAVHAALVGGIAGERAADHSRGPGSFQVAFLDALHALGAADLAGRGVDSEDDA